MGLWNLSHLALLGAAFWLTWVAWRRLGAAFGAYSAATLAIVLSAPAEGFPLVSLPRLLLADFPLFLALASLTLDRPRTRDAVLVVFAALGAAATVAFARGIWIVDAEAPPTAWAVAPGASASRKRDSGSRIKAAVEHSLLQVRSPWRTVTIVASGVAAIELVALIALAVVLLAKPVSSTSATRPRRR